MLKRHSDILQTRTFDCSTFVCAVSVDPASKTHHSRLHGACGCCTCARTLQPPHERQLNTLCREMQPCRKTFLPVKHRLTAFRRCTPRAHMHPFCVPKMHAQRPSMMFRHNVAAHHRLCWFRVPTDPMPCPRLPWQCSRCGPGRNVSSCAVATSNSAPLTRACLFRSVQLLGTCVWYSVSSGIEV